MTRGSVYGAALACLALGVGAPARAQARPDSIVRPDSVVRREVRIEYDSLADSTTRHLSAYAAVDTGATPPDTFALELSQRWRGRDTPAPVAPLELGLGRTRATGLPLGPSILAPVPRRPAVVFQVDGGRRIRLEQSEYVSDASAGRRAMTFETARYRIAPAELRRIAETRELRLWVGERELWVDPAWRAVAAEMLARQGEKVSKH